MSCACAGEQCRSDISIHEYVHEYVPPACAHRDADYLAAELPTSSTSSADVRSPVIAAPVGGFELRLILGLPPCTLAAASLSLDTRHADRVFAIRCSAFASAHLGPRPSNDESGSARMSKYGSLYPSMSPQSLSGHADNFTLSTLMTLKRRGEFDISMHQTYDMLRGSTS